MGADRNTITTSRALMTRMTQKLPNRLLTKEMPAVAIKRSLLLFLLFPLRRARPHLGLPGHEREVLSQGVALEGLGQHQLHQVRMPLEHDAEELPGLPLVPVGPRIEVGDGRTAGLLAGQPDLHPD